MTPAARAADAVLTLPEARRLALHAQGLALPAPRRRATPADVADLVARLGCLQLDPVAPVARSPLLVAHSRLGRVDDAALLAAAYEHRLLFDAWAHEASLVHVVDLPLHRWAQHRRATRPSLGGERARAFLAANPRFVSALLGELRERGPLRASEVASEPEVDWEHGHWTDEVSRRQTVNRALGLLWRGGRVGVAGRRGLERLWDLPERCVDPVALAAADAAPLDDATAWRLAARRALRLLGVARPTQVRNHFLRGELPDAGAVLEAEPDVVAVEVAGTKGRWHAFADDLERLPGLQPGGRTVALSPFDNVLCDRARTAELFGFDHRLEIYTPAARRRWGYYVLPILHGERFVARADLRVEDRRLELLALHHEPGRRAPGAVRAALERLAAWRGVAPPA